MSTVPSGITGVNEKPVSFISKSRPLCGTLAFTDNSPIKTGVITLHGWGGDRCGPHRMLVHLGRKLAAEGFTTLRFDISGRGASQCEEHITLDDMIDDALAAREYIINECGCEQAVFCGICSGGNVAIGAATLADTPALALISILPFSARSENMARKKQSAFLLQYFKKACSLHTWKRLFRGEINFGGVGKTLTQAGAESTDERSLKDSQRDIMAAFSATGQPCLFVYGSEDAEAPAAREYYEPFCKNNNIPAKFAVIPDANHNFMACQLSELVVDMVSEFICTTLQKK